MKLFEALRTEARIPLGIDEYLDLIRAMQTGFGIHDLEGLRRLCLLLWANSKDEIALVNYHFERIVTNVERTAQPSEDNILLPEKEDSTNEKEKSEPASNSTETIQPVDREGERKKTAAREAAQRQAVAHQTELLALQRKRYILQVRYTHLSDRTLAQAWRKLRLRARNGSKSEFDIDATIQEVARTGHFLSPVYQKGWTNVADVHFLLDRDGSMVPFHSFSKMLLHGAKTVGNLPKIQTRYFHDFPSLERKIYRQEMLSNPQKVREWLQSLDRKHALVVIVSDGGAARHNFDQARIDKTAAFLLELQGHCHRAVWLNPMPPTRWGESTAAAIAQSIPMFESNAQGLNHAVDYLRGKLDKAKARFTQFATNPNTARS